MITGQLLHVGATVICAHGGPASAALPNPRVMVTGQPTVMLPGQWVVAGCAMPPPPAGNGPCVTATFITGSTRVHSLGQSLVLMGSVSVATPTGAPLIPIAAQTRVLAT